MGTTTLAYIAEITESRASGHAPCRLARGTRKRIGRKTLHGHVCADNPAGDG